jgi:hypothetical protein
MDGAQTRSVQELAHAAHGCADTLLSAGTRWRPCDITSNYAGAAL